MLALELLEIPRANVRRICLPTRVSSCQGTPFEALGALSMLRKSRSGARQNPMSTLCCISLRTYEEMVVEAKSAHPQDQASSIARRLEREVVGYLNPAAQN